MKRVPALATQQQQRTPQRGALAWLLMLAVLFGQGLGAVHAISHGVSGAVGHTHAHTHTQTHAQAHAQTQPQALALPVHHGHGPACEHGHGPGLQTLFDHAPDEPACRIYDQLLQAGPLMPVATVLAAPARARTVPAPGIAMRLAVPAAVYQARGPPLA